MHHSIALTYFSIAALVVLLFAGTMAFSLLGVKNRSRSTFHFGMIYVFTAVMGIAYLFGQSYAEPAGASHRWFTVFGALAAITHAAAFFFYFPEPRSVRFGRGLLFAQYATAIGASILFFIKTLSAGRGYRFEGHYFDFDAEELSHAIGILIQIYMLVFVVAGIWRSFVSHGRDRWVTVGILFFMMGMTLAPGVANTLSRDGAISRDFYQTLWCVAIVVSGFFAVILFMNHTKDRTSFMSKIVGTSLATVLLILQILSLVSLSSLEEAFDDHYRLTAARVVRDPQFRPQELRYIVSYDPVRQELSPSAYGALEGADIPVAEVQNTFIREQIRALTNLPEDQRATALSRILREAPPSFAGYAGAIQSLAGSASDPGSIERILSAIDALERPVLHRRIKLGRLRASDFPQGLEEWAAKPETALIPFAAAVRALLKDPQIDRAELKEEALACFAAAAPAGHRGYRKQMNGSARYVAFFEVVGDRGYEVGFDYESYRKFVHPVSVKFSLTIIGAMLVVVLGFQVFFLGNLVNPLRSLLRGVTEVNKGDLAVSIPVRIQDEIGFLTDSFNGMVSSIRDARARLQEYANHLEEKVRDRTAELRTTLEEVQALKLQQDGDYYLTSLLLKPLGANRARSETVSVQFFMRQKKRFQFRKWQEEIGGDMCISDNLTLAGQPFTIFLNADAMGKSMQGAGGALVLGSVFESVLERTKSSSAVNEQYPERWLKNTFIELHKVFNAFDGSMLVSVFLGVLDEKTGLLYSINAEHPWTILYRDGKASFIESELLFRKLGMPGIDSTLFVSTFQLQPGDVLIAGSDGRDDIEHETEGGSTINEDETRILRHVEANKANLEDIAESLSMDGRLIDDLSFVRVGYREGMVGTETAANPAVAALVAEAEELGRSGQITDAVQKLEWAHSLDPADASVLKLLCRDLVQLRRFEAASRFLDRYLDLVPGDTENVYVASYCFKKTGNFRKAADFGERVRLRKPDHIKNLLNLGDVYFLLKNYNRATELFTRVLDLDPANQLASRAMAKLEKPEP